VSWESDDGLERGGACNECGEPVEQEHHAFCPSCFRAQMGWTRESADSAFSPEPAFPGDDRWDVAYMRGYRDGYRDGQARGAA
jgi:hypothetical protein